MSNEEESFLVDLLIYLASEDLADIMFFSEDQGNLKIIANCNDLFWWATADGEEITPSNIDIFKRSVIDCKEAGNQFVAPELFAARVRGMRPQDAAYPDEKELWPLFDAAGPERSESRVRQPIQAGILLAETARAKENKACRTGRRKRQTPKTTGVVER